MKRKTASAVDLTTPIPGGAESAERKQELGRVESGGGDLQAQALGFELTDCHYKPHDLCSQVEDSHAA